MCNFDYISRFLKLNNSYIHIYRLYTGPKDSYFSNVLSTPLYKKVKENNVDLESSFNIWKISINKTLNEPKSALFAYSFLEHCMVRYYDIY